jgi:hypothetical protein
MPRIRKINANMRSRVMNLDLEMPKDGYDVGKEADWIRGNGKIVLMEGQWALEYPPRQVSERKPRILRPKQEGAVENVPTDGTTQVV